MQLPVLVLWSEFGDQAACPVQEEQPKVEDTHQIMNRTRHDHSVVVVCLPNEQINSTLVLNLRRTRHNVQHEGLGSYQWSCRLSGSILWSLLRLDIWYYVCRCILSVPQPQISRNLSVAIPTQKNST